MVKMRPQEAKDVVPAVVTSPSYSRRLRRLLATTGDIARVAIQVEAVEPAE